MLIALLTLEALLLNGLGYGRILQIWQAIVGIGGKQVSLEVLREHRFKPEVFDFQRSFSVIAAGGWTLVYALLKQQKQAIIQAVPFVKSSLKQAVYSPIDLLKSLSNSEKFIFYIVFASFAAIYAFFSATLPIYYDEAWTYLVFTRKGVIESATYYPMPNNHVFFSILTAIFSLVKIFPTLQIRLVSALSALLAGFIFWRLLRDSSKTAAILASVFLMSLFGFFHYAVLARGYALQTLFVILAVYSLQSYFTTPDKKYRLFYVLAMVGGFWTIPTFLYPGVILHIALFFVLNRNIKQWFQATSQLIIGLWLVYFPLILRNGLSALVSNSTNERVPFAVFLEKLPEHLHRTLNFLVGFNTSAETAFFLIFGIVFCLIFLFFLDKLLVETGQIRLLNLLFFALFLSPLLLFLHSVIPFERTWTFLSLSIAWAFFAVLMACSSILKRILKLKNQENRWKKGSFLIQLTAIIFIIIPQIYNFNIYYKQDLHLEDYELGNAAAQLKKRTGNTVYTNFWWTDTQVEYAQATDWKPVFSELIREIPTDTTHFLPDLLVFERNNTKSRYKQYLHDTAHYQRYAGLRVDFFIKK